MGNLSDITFNAASSQSATGSKFEPLPAGTYRVTVFESEKRRNKKDNGNYVVLNMQVVSGDYKGRRVRQFFNVEHDDEATEARGKADFEKVLFAVNVLKPDDTSQVHGIPMLVRIAIKDDPQFGKQNVVRDYMRDDGYLADGEQLPVVATTPQAAKPAASPQPRAAAKPRVAAPPVPNDDDIPF